jgi:DNA polymerase I-like protein with 3'-5' exonuclease and polymerase domains
MIGEYVLAGNKNVRINLDATAARRKLPNKMSLVSKLIKSGVCPSEIPISMLRKYCKQDTHLCREIFLQQRKDLLANELLPVAFTRNIATPVLVDIESRGMHLDRDRVIQENIIYERKYDSISREISEFTSGINLNSPKQVAELLYDRLGFSECKDKRGFPIRTDTDQRRTDEKTIEQLTPRNKSQRRFLELFKERATINAALTKNLQFFRAVVEETPDHIFYGNLNQTVTKTHRLSSTSKRVAFDLFGGKLKGIQMQNIPRAFKSLFSPRNKGWFINETDAAQLEFRVAAFLGGDEVARSDIESGRDVHQYTADKLTEAGEPSSRQDAKSRTFKPLYGGTSGTKAERAYYDAFKQRYQGITDEQERWKGVVEKTKQLRIASGLIFYWPDTKMEGSSYRPYLRNTTSICNFPVQSFATADIIPIGVTAMWHRMKREGLVSFIINTIHDSIISEVHPNEVEIFNKIGELSFTSVVKEYLKRIYKVNFNVPLAVEAKTGEYWNG